MSYKTTVNYNELYHHGIKKQKWGVRRYQNEDGSLTEAGRKRYARDAKEKGYNKYDKDNESYYKSSKKNGREDLDVDAERYVKEDITRTRTVANEVGSGVNKLRNYNENAMRKKPKVKMDLSNMSDKQMRDEINRALLERQYNDMFAPQTTSKGREYLNKTLTTAGNVLTTTGTVLTIALAIKELKGK